MKKLYFRICQIKGIINGTFFRFIHAEHYFGKIYWKKRQLITNMISYDEEYMDGSYKTGPAFYLCGGKLKQLFDSIGIYSYFRGGGDGVLDF